MKGEITGQGVRTEWVPCASREYIHLTVEGRDGGYDRECCKTYLETDR